MLYLCVEVAIRKGFVTLPVTSWINGLSKEVGESGNNCSIDPETCSGAVKASDDYLPNPTAIREILELPALAINHIDLDKAYHVVKYTFFLI